MNCDTAPEVRSWRKSNFSGRWALSRKSAWAAAFALSFGALTLASAPASAHHGMATFAASQTFATNPLRSGEPGGAVLDATFANGDQIAARR